MSRTIWYLFGPASKVGIFSLLKCRGVVEQEPQRRISSSRIDFIIPIIPPRTRYVKQKTNKTSRKLQSGAPTAKMAEEGFLWETLEKLPSRFSLIAVEVSDNENP